MPLSENDKQERAEARARQRRAHKKSRNGCSQCKRRHIKCDESQPACSSCVVAGLDCPFLSDPNIRGTGQSPVTTTSRPSPTIEPRSRSSTVALPSSTSHGSGCCDGEVNMVHLQLFSHFMSETSHQVMYYQHLATSLQSKALAGFNEAVQEINERNCLTLLIFSHMLGVHSFCEVFISQDESFSNFLTRLLQAIHLLRGINSVIQPWWHVLSTTDMIHLMREGEAHRIARESLETTVPHLHDLMATADISETSLRIYQEALRRLDLALHGSSEPRDDINIVFAWLVTSPKEYTDLLAERRPEALVLLAYYAVVLHRRRNSWLIGTAGRRMYGWIRDYLGDRWAHWLPPVQMFDMTEAQTPA
ncbi:hypothetical protein D6D20_03278 [Aureobasidium pullulans]|uniref:Zn(2)-C6 fungal-type domain-containing protein n=1 Tax=Aureobasidium pullulans TaxID=5580 RepID=A0A4S8ZDV4_AURPU|nr:hypothetical protein D6D20_03278 [Aureobasidium pullulans]